MKGFTGFSSTIDLLPHIETTDLANSELMLLSHKNKFWQASYTANNNSIKNYSLNLISHLAYFKYSTYKFYLQVIHQARGLHEKCNSGHIAKILIPKPG